MAHSSSAYPFVTRREIEARLESEPAFLTECARILQTRTEQRNAGTSPVGKAWGWMSSERVIAGRLVAKQRIGMLSGDEEAKLAKLASRYSRQLADHFRALALQENPALSAAAERFGVGPTDSNPSDVFQCTPASKEIPSRCHPSRERQPDDLEYDLELDAEPVQEDELAPRVTAFVERSPGLRTNAIADALGVTTALLAPTLRMLVQGKRLKKHGFGRGTKYFVR